MPIDPRTGQHVNSLPAMDIDGHVMTDAEIRQMRRALRQQLELMRVVLPEVHPPHPQSVLAAVDGASFQREQASVIIANGITAACAHLQSAHEFADTHGANRITAWSLLRPALMSATIAGWVVSASGEEQLRRAAVVSNEAIAYELAYVDNAAKIPGAQTAERKAWLEQRRVDLYAWAESGDVLLKTKDRVPMTNAIREVARRLDLEEPRYSAHWNEMSSGAHGLSWHVMTRTYGAPTSVIADSGFTTYATDLQPATYVHAVADITEYTNRVLSLTRTLASDLARLAEAGVVTINNDGGLTIQQSFTPLLQPTS